jgi:hypothetical protein
MIRFLFLMALLSTGAASAGPYVAIDKTGDGGSAYAFYEKHQDIERKGVVAVRRCMYRTLGDEWYSVDVKPYTTCPAKVKIEG